MKEGVEYVICETKAAIVTHLREVTGDTPIRDSGHSMPRPKTVCDMEAAWDLPKMPLSGCSCQKCLELTKS